MKNTVVYVVIEQKSEDYHGIYKEIIDIYSIKEDAINAIELLREENYDSNIDYYIENFIVK